MIYWWIFNEFFSCYVVDYKYICCYEYCNDYIFVCFFQIVYDLCVKLNV